jgi:class 3 adenylate cyclase
MPVVSTVVPLAPHASCPSCSNPIEHNWRHCGVCGQQLAHDDRPEESHTVTLVVSDLQGSTALAEALDPETLRLVLDRYFDELFTDDRNLRSAAERMGVTVLEPAGA